MYHGIKEKNDVLVSFIVPIYDTSEYLHRCIDSICSQTYRNLQIILVDDGSNDSSTDICKYYAEKDNRIQFISLPHKGVSTARNTGLSVAKGDYICFVDSDDWIERNMVECCLTYFDIHIVDIVIFDFWICNDQGNRKHCAGSNDYGTFSREDYLCEQEGWVPSSVCNKMYKSNIIQNSAFDKDLSYGEDMMFNLSVFQKMNAILCCNDILYHYNQAERNQPSLSRPDSHEAPILAYGRWLEFWEGQNPIYLHDKRIVYCASMMSAYFNLSEYDVQNNSLDEIKKNFDEKYSLLNTRNIEDTRLRICFALFHADEKLFLLLRKIYRCIKFFVKS